MHRMEQLSALSSFEHERYKLVWRLRIIAPPCLYSSNKAIHPQLLYFFIFLVMKTLPFWKKSLYSALIFFGTLIVLSVGYSAWNAAMSKVSPGNPLSAAGWNALVDNIADLDSRWSRSGGNLVFTGGNVGVGTTSPQTPMHIMGSISAPSISGTPNGSLMIGSNETGVQVAMGITADVSPQYGWIQPRYANNGNVHNLVLNPNGGNV